MAKEGQDKVEKEKAEEKQVKAKKKEEKAEVKGEKEEDKKGSRIPSKSEQEQANYEQSSQQHRSSGNIPAVEKVKDIKVSKKEVKSELEREYIVPLRKKVNKVPRYKRAKKAVKVLKEFIAKHMKVEDRDLNKVKVDKFLNNEIWFRGIKKPPAKIKVKAVKDSEGIVRIELVDIPEKVKFAMGWEKKRDEKVKTSKKKEKVEEKKEEKGSEEEKKDGQEKEKASVEAGLKAQKVQAKQAKHTATGKHEKTTAPVRKALKK